MIWAPKATTTSSRKSKVALVGLRARVRARVRVRVRVRAKG